MTASSLSQLLRERIGRHARAGRTALLGPTRSTSYAELGTSIDGYASALRRVVRGALVGVPAARSDDSVALFFGVMQAGGCPCFVEPGLAAEALLSRAHAVGLRRIVLGEGSEAMARDLEHGELQVHRAADLARVARKASRGTGAIDDTLGPADLAMMQLTSGSTGLPKGALLTHGNLLRHAAGIIERTTLAATDRLLHVMPLHHTNGVNNQLIAPFLAGASVVLAERFRAEDVEDRIAAHGVTYLTGVPTMYSRMLPHLRDQARLRSLRFLRCGSAPITVRLHEEVEAAFGVPLIVSYGLSEATCTSTMNPVGARRIGTVGTALRGQRVRIFRPGTEDESPAGAEGEIRIAGPCLMRGYAGDGSESPIRDGWLRTGDLGRFDADAYLAVTGRLKDVIVRGGENLSPRAIEDILARHPGVAACCVVGAPHPDLGEVPVAFVVRRDGMAVDAAALAALVRRRLSKAHIPATIRFVEALPVNAVGKVDRKALRASSTRPHD
ncbi:MAG: class I adenylate-forming enzyme family protein [Acidobacteria bacterium]|nr:class I adenylate-forming enzyme family protein [Acidobacteriota bacterium]